MENASKALIMAAAILIAIVIISLSVWFFQRSSNLVKDNDFSQVEIDNFNSKIEAYCGENVSGSQVNSLINLIRSIDLAAQSNEGETLYADIIYKDKKIEFNKSSFEITTDTLTKVPTGSSKYYKVNVEYGASGAIKKIIISD